VPIGRLSDALENPQHPLVVELHAQLIPPMFACKCGCHVWLRAKIVPVSIERGLLEKADSFARRHNLKRSQMVADGPRLVMRSAKAK